MKHNSKTPMFSLIMALYWANYCLMFNFASLYLLDAGFSNSRIGLILGLSYALSAVCQPVFAALFNRNRLCLSSAIACFFSFNALMALSVLVFRGSKLLLAARIVIIFMLHSALQPSVNSIHRGYELQGVKVNFGLARGLGSTMFSLTSALMGFLLRYIAPRLIPLFYMFTTAALAVSLFAFRSPGFCTASADAEKPKRRSPLLRSRRFLLFLPGVAGLTFTHIFIDNFMLQLMQSLGGGSSELGIAIALASFTELPAMALYTRMRRKIDVSITLTIAGWLWALRSLLMLFAKTPASVYCVAVLQFCGYAFYVPAAVDFVIKVLPPEDFLKGQALTGSAFTTGCLMATLFGGPLLDRLGVHRALTLLQIASIAGAILLTVSVPNWKGNSRQSPRNP